MQIGLSEVDRDPENFEDWEGLRQISNNDKLFISKLFILGNSLTYGQSAWSRYSLILITTIGV